VWARSFSIGGTTAAGRLDTFTIGSAKLFLGNDTFSHSNVSSPPSISASRFNRQRHLYDRQPLGFGKRHLYYDRRASAIFTTGNDTLRLAALASSRNDTFTSTMRHLCRRQHVPAWAAYDWRTTLHHQHTSQQPGQRYLHDQHAEASATDTFITINNLFVPTASSRPLYHRHLRLCTIPLASTAWRFRPRNNTFTDRQTSGTGSDTFTITIVASVRGHYGNDSFTIGSFAPATTILYDHESPSRPGRATIPLPSQIVGQAQIILSWATITLRISTVYL